MTEPLATLLHAGLLKPKQIDEARPSIDGWTDEERAEVECWAADYHLWNTDFVSFAIGPAPGPLCALLDALGTGHLLDGYRGPR
jgi:hypothetical protein